MPRKTEQDQTEANQENSLVDSGLGFDVAPPPQEDDPKPAYVPEPEVKSLTAKERAEEEYRAAQDEKKRAFAEAVLAARTPEEKKVVVSPVAPRIIEQTNAEMEAGRRMNDHHAGLQAQRPVRIPNPAEGNMTPVFRPNDYVPDPKKGQGNVGARNL